MKKFLEMILERASEFINYKKDTQEVEEDNANILQTIETALQKNRVYMSFFQIKVLLVILSNMTKSVSN